MEIRNPWRWGQRRTSHRQNGVSRRHPFICHIWRASSPDAASRCNRRVIWQIAEAQAKGVCVQRQRGSFRCDSKVLQKAKDLTYARYRVARNERVVVGSAQRIVRTCRTRRSYISGACHISRTFRENATQRRHNRSVVLCELNVRNNRVGIVCGLHGCRGVRRTGDLERGLFKRMDAIANFAQEALGPRDRSMTQLFGNPPKRSRVVPMGSDKRLKVKDAGIPVWTRHRRTVSGTGSGAEQLQMVLATDASYTGGEDLLGSRWPSASASHEPRTATVLDLCAG